LSHLVGTNETLATRSVLDWSGVSSARLNFAVAKSRVENRVARNRQAYWIVNMIALLDKVVYFQLQP
jgi:hypothetical protein